jgi:hypothetical protein
LLLRRIQETIFNSDPEPQHCEEEPTVHLNHAMITIDISTAVAVLSKLFILFNPGAGEKTNNQVLLITFYYEISTRMGQPTTHVADGFEEGGWVGDGQDAEEDETQLLHLIPAHHPLQAANLHHHAQNYLKLVSIKT